MRLNVRPGCVTFSHLYRNQWFYWIHLARNSSARLGPLPWFLQTTFHKKGFRSKLHKTNKKHSPSRMVGCCLIIHSLRMLPPNRQAGVGSDTWVTSLAAKKHQVSPSDQYRHPVWHQENYSIGWISPPASCNILSTSPWRSLKNDPIHVGCSFIYMLSTRSLSQFLP